MRLSVGKGVAATVSAELIDECGSILRAEPARDASRFLMTMVGGFALPGPAKAADRIAD